MKKLRLLLVVVLSLSLATALLGLTACGGGGGVAATVNGTEIKEQEVTDSIEAMRAQNEDYQDPAKWAKALSGSGLTPESLRESIIDSKARTIVITQEAESQGLSVSEEEIDTQIEQTKSTVGGDDEAWLETLKQYGYQDEQAYRDFLKSNALETQLYENFEIEGPTDDELKEYIAANPTTVEGWSLADGATADAAEAEATEEATEETAEGTEVEVVDDAVTAETPTYTAADVDLSTIPEDILTQYKEIWTQSNKGTKFNEWTTELVDSADIVINEMPEDVPYNVDMSLAESSDASADSGAASEETPVASLSSAEAIEAALAEGLIIEDETVGDGDEAHDGDAVRVLYTGMLEDGTVFDSTADRGDEPIEFVLGTGGVIKGWDAGVVGMKVGGKRLLTIPASLAYGDAGSTDIPPGATLTFEIELVEVTHAH